MAPCSRCESKPVLMVADALQWLSSLSGTKTTLCCHFVVFKLSFIEFCAY